MLSESYTKKMVQKVIKILNEKEPQSSGCGTVETNLTRNHKVAGLIPGLAQWVKDLPLL